MPRGSVSEGLEIVAEVLCDGGRLTRLHTVRVHAQQHRLRPAQTKIRQFFF